MFLCGKPDRAPVVPLFQDLTWGSRNPRHHVCLWVQFRDCESRHRYIYNLKKATRTYSMYWLKGAIGIASVRGITFEKCPLHRDQQTPILAFSWLIRFSEKYILETVESYLVYVLVSEPRLHGKWCPWGSIYTYICACQLPLVTDVEWKLCNNIQPTWLGWGQERRSASSLLPDVCKNEIDRTGEWLGWLDSTEDKRGQRTPLNKQTKLWE